MSEKKELYYELDEDDLDEVIGGLTISSPKTECLYFLAKQGGATSGGCEQCFYYGLDPANNEHVCNEPNMNNTSGLGETPGLRGRR